MNKSAVDGSRLNSSLCHLELNVKLEMSGSTDQQPLEVTFQGMRVENTSFKFFFRTPTPTIGINVVMELICIIVYKHYISLICFNSFYKWVTLKIEYTHVLI